MLTNDYFNDIPSSQFWQLFKTATSICNIYDLKDLSDALLSQTLELVHAEACALYLVSGQHQKSRLQLQSIAHQGTIVPVDHHQFRPIECWHGGRPRYERPVMGLSEKAPKSGNYFILSF